VSIESYYLLILIVVVVLQIKVVTNISGGEIITGRDIVIVSGGLMKIKTETNARVERLELLKRLYPPYWDEEYSNSWRKLKGGKLSNDITNYLYRSYRTWKHTRKKQYKSR